VLLTGGSEQSRDLPVPGRDLDGIHFAMEFLPQQNKVNAGDKLKDQLRADGKHVIVIGGGDTGSDCVGTSNRHGAVSVTQFEVMPQPPAEENRPLDLALLAAEAAHQLPAMKKVASACSAISTKEFIGEKGKVTGLKTVQVEFKDGKLMDVPGTEKVLKADLVLLAMGFVNPVATVLESFGVDKDARGNAKATTDFTGGYATNVPKVFAAGDIRRGQSLVVWAIREGRQAARAVDEFLMGIYRTATLDKGFPPYHSKAGHIPALLSFMATTPSSALVELKNVSFGYGERRILDGVSLTVPRGKVTALMGASGGGKTTVLRLIGGQNPGASGQVLLRRPNAGDCHRTF